MELTRNEKSLLLYFETQAVDYGGTLESVRLNAEDFATARRWNEAGFVHFGRIAFNDIKTHGGVARDHWCVLSDEAWNIAHAERRARCERVMGTLKVQRKGLPTPESMMSMHKKPLLLHEETALVSHGLPVGQPSQLADAFRMGMEAERERCAKLCDALSKDCTGINARLAYRYAATEIRGKTPNTTDDRR